MVSFIYYYFSDHQISFKLVNGLRIRGALNTSVHFTLVANLGILLWYGNSLPTLG